MPGLDNRFVPSLSHVLEQWRIERGFTWTKFAELAGQHMSTISSLRGGYRSLTPQLAEKIAKAAEHDVGDLYAEIAERYIQLKEADILARYQQSIRAGNDYLEFIRTLLNPDTVPPLKEYWLVTTEPPMEFRSDALDDQIIAAIKRGVSFQYLFPKPRANGIGGDQATQLLSRHFLRMGSFGLHEQFQAWHNQLLKLSNDDYDVKTKIKAKSIPLSPSTIFFAPYVKFALLRLDNEQPQAWIEVLYDAPAISIPRCFVRLNSNAAGLLDNWCLAVNSS